MARFFGKVGFGLDVNQGNGIWTPGIVENTYSGDVIRNYKRNQETDVVNDDVTTSTAISIVATTYAIDHVSAIRYVEWMGVLWKVRLVNSEHPRLILELGGKYNGPTPN